MKNLASHIILFFSLSLYAIVWIVLHPYLGYLLDSDGIAYLTIARRVSEGQYLQSVNGLWSPLNSWLLSPFISKGMDAWSMAKVMNMFFGAVVIVLSHCLFQQFNLKKSYRAPLMFALSIAMVYNVYLQMFGDVLQLIFLLIYFMLLASNQFKISIPKSLGCGLVIGFAFYAKAYSFAFFAIHFLIVLLWLFYKNKISLRQAGVNYLIGLLASILLMLPWSFALQKKYGEWSLMGFSGKMNMSWQINSAKSFKSDIDLLIPPSQTDSPSFWEDPYPTQENLSTPFTSGKHFVKWIARIIHTCLSCLVCFNELSFLALALLCLALYFYFYHYREEVNTITEQLILISIIVLPLGYLMMHIETRYIWFNTFLLMSLGALLLKRFEAFLHPLASKTFLYTFAFSFIVYPVLQMEVLRNKNKELFNYANAFKVHEMKGSFTSNAIDAGRMWVIAYVSGNPFYTIERTDYSESELTQEMKRYDVKYYVYESENNKTKIQLSNLHFKYLYKLDGLDIYQFIK